MGRTGRMKTQQRDWDELAEFNPEWAVLTSSDTRDAGWDAEEFFASGQAVVDQVMNHAEALGLPAGGARVLDFGCGVGRVAPALRRRFDRYVGVDVSDQMVARAQRLNADSEGIEFVVNDRADLSRFGDAEFDGIISFLVLQHLPSREVIRSYLREFARVFAPGGVMVIQLVTYIQPIQRLRVRRRLYRFVRALGVSVERAHGWGLHAMLLTAIPIDDVLDVLREAGCDVRWHGSDEPMGPGVQSTTFYVTK